MIDGHGVDYHNAAGVLRKRHGIRVSLWPAVRQIRDLVAADRMRLEFDRCMICGDKSDLELHHLIHGSGRSDERCCMSVLCRSCHRMRHEGIISWGVCVVSRHAAEPESMDWCRLALLWRRFLPDI